MPKSSAPVVVPLFYGAVLLSELVLVGGGGKLVLALRCLC